MSIFTAEMIGTAILILLGDGVVAAVLLNRSKAQNAGWIVITLGWGFAVAIAVYAVVQYSGAHINPAVTLALWSLDNGSVDSGDVYKYLLGQYAGAGIGALLVFLTYYLHWRDTEDQGLKLAVFCTGPAIRNPVFNFITEFVGTVMLVFGVLAIGNQFTEGGLGGAADLSTALGGSFTPLLVGFLVVAIGLSLGGPTGYAINPARDLGPRIMHAILPIPGKGGSDWGYALIPVIGPIAGGIVGAQLFDALYPG